MPADSRDLFPPSLALMVMMKRQRSVNLFQRKFPLGCSHLNGGWNYNEVSVGVNLNVQVDLLKVPTPQPIPISNCLPNRLAGCSLLDSVMPHSARHDFAVLDLVVPVNRHEGAGNYPVRCLQDNLARPALAKELLHRFGEVMKEVLGPARGTAAVLCLLQMHGQYSFCAAGSSDSPVEI
jgi:hypothetical protein